MGWDQGCKEGPGSVEKPHAGPLPRANVCAQARDRKRERGRMRRHLPPATQSRTGILVIKLSQPSTCFIIICNKVKK